MLSEQLYVWPLRTSYTERPISSLGWMGEAGGRLIQVEISLVMSKEAPMQPASKSEAAHANYADPIPGHQWPARPSWGSKFLVFYKMKMSTATLIGL